MSGRALSCKAIGAERTRGCKPFVDGGIYPGIPKTIRTDKEETMNRHQPHGATDPNPWPADPPPPPKN